MMHALAALLLAAAAPASDAPASAPRADDLGPGKPIVRLVTAEDVAKLCAALEPPERLQAGGDALERGEAEAQHASARESALAARYEVTVPGAKLPFAPYDGPERRLALSEPVQIALAEGVRLWPTEERSLAVEIDATVARRILEAQRNGTLSLALRFDLPEDATCGSARGNRSTVPVEPVAWRWLNSDAVLARGGAGSDLPLLSARDGARPRVDVGDPIAGPIEAKKAVLARSGELEACYAEALKRDPRIDGVLVADIGGQRPAISADSVGDEALAACVQSVLRPLEHARGGKVAVPIRFELEPPGTKRASEK